MPRSSRAATVAIMILISYYDEEREGQRDRERLYQRVELTRSNRAATVAIMILITVRREKDREIERGERAAEIENEKGGGQSLRKIIPTSRIA